MKLKSTKFKSPDKTSFKKKMWHSLKKHIGLLTNIVADYSVILQLSKLSLRSSHNISNTLNGNHLRLATVYSGVSKHLTSPLIKKGVIGEDAFFVTSQKNCDVLGVADGVGGWSSVGIDPSVFSSSLMKQCKRFIEKDDLATFETTPDTPMALNTPIKILDEAYKSLIQRKDEQLIGSATACIILFDYTTNNLISANLGDSGFVVIRNDRIIHRSVEQQHYFNCPYQLAIYPKNVQNVQQDKPDSAFVSVFQLAEGDLICLATDGLWDNLSDELLLKILKEKIQNHDDLAGAAKKIVENAVQISLDNTYLTPFAISARQNHLDYTGGKPDDITVLLARVSY